jgi:hypothetical protein
MESKGFELVEIIKNPEMVEYKCRSCRKAELTRENILGVTKILKDKIRYWSKVFSEKPTGSALDAALYDLNEWPKIIDEILKKTS